MTIGNRPRLFGWRGALAVAIATAGTAVLGYFSIFSIFIPWDDEGYMLVSLRAYTAGGVLYRDVFTQYGPFYYELVGNALRTIANIISFQPESHMSAWLATILRNLFRTKYRGRRRAVEDADGRHVDSLKSPPERLSRVEMGRRLADFHGADASVIRVARHDQVTLPEPRPRDVSLDSSLWRGLFPALPWPTLEGALSEMQVHSRGGGSAGAAHLE